MAQDHQQNQVYSICLYDEDEECIETFVFSTKEKQAEALRHLNNWSVSIQTLDVDPDVAAWCLSNQGS